MQDENLYLDRESQILAINKTFESAKKPITSHPGKPGVKPVEILPVFPDFDLWKYPFAQVMFDADPAPIEKEKEMSQAMIRGVMDESGEQFVAYFLPAEDTMNKRKVDELEGRDYTEEQEYEYNMAREYNWNVKNKATKDYDENYFFVWRDDCVCYNELETRVKLSKRRVKHNAPSNSKLVVKHRQLNEQEYKIQEIRNSQLEPPQDEEEVVNNNNENRVNNMNGDQEDKENGIDDKESVVSEPEASDKSDDSDSESEPEIKAPKRQKVSDKSQSEKSSSSSSESSSDSDSDGNSSSSASGDDKANDGRQNQRIKAADIFGSDSD